jgi:hypothetical protein
LVIRILCHALSIDDLHPLIDILLTIASNAFLARFLALISIFVTFLQADSEEVCPIGSHPDLCMADGGDIRNSVQKTHCKCIAAF